MRKMLSLEAIQAKGIRLLGADHELSYNRIHELCDSIEGITIMSFIAERSRLQAFAWGSTPQGDEYWRRVADNRPERDSRWGTAILDLFTEDKENLEQKWKEIDDAADCDSDL